MATEKIECKVLPNLRQKVECVIDNSEVTEQDDNKWKKLNFVHIQLVYIGTINMA